MSESQWLAVQQQVAYILERYTQHSIEVEHPEGAKIKLGGASYIDANELVGYRILVMLSL
jgi:hypothetical protein